MSIVITELIDGQEATSTCTYCYLYEPLRVLVAETNLEVTKIYLDLIVRDTTDFSNTIETIIRYGDYDVNPGIPISIDLMKLARQHHDANIYKYSSEVEMADIDRGWHSVVSKYKYQFRFTSALVSSSRRAVRTTTPTPANVSVIKLPIIGGRSLPDFSGAVALTQPLTEAELLGVNIDERWKNYPTMFNSLQDPTLDDSRAVIAQINTDEGVEPCAGILIWKSRFGGWMNWGFKIKTETSKSRLSGNLNVGMFESTFEDRVALSSRESIPSEPASTEAGQPYVQPDYTEITMSYSITLKALSLTALELRAVRGISTSPAIYYKSSPTSRLELMKLTSATHPLSNLANGGDFSVSLRSISTSSHKTM